MSEERQEKKIIVDEDWKSQVEREKVELEQERHKQQAEPSTTETPKMPEASFSMHLTTLATEAMVGLGQIPHPATGKAEIHLDHAKYMIDTLHMLEEKTRGNLTPEEKNSLEGLLHQLRMAFVAMQNAPPPEASQQTSASEKPDS